MTSTPKAPAAPDPAETARAQGAANLETAVAQGWLNATNQVGPYGTVTYTQNGTQKVGDKDVPQFTQTTTLSPAQQQQLDQQNELQNQALGLGKQVLGNVGDVVSQPFSLDGLPPAPGMGDFTKDRDIVVNSLLERNQPVMDRTRARQENQLANQGIVRGSEAWNNAQDDLARQENDFRLGAQQAGSAEQSRLFGLSTTARQNALQEAALKRSQPINEYATLLGLGGQVQAPTASYQAPQLANTDTTGPTNLAYQAKLAQYNAQNQARQGIFGGISSLGAAALPLAFSDMRMKESIRHIGYENGFPIYHFKYRFPYMGNPAHTIYRGVMAQDVMFLQPDAIAFDDRNMMMVNYEKIGIEMGVVH